jgi:carboxyl-terminal processing protease
MRSRRQHIIRLTLVMVFVAVLSSAATAGYMRYGLYGDAWKEFGNLDFNKFVRVFKIVTEQYVDPVPATMVMEGALSGMVDSLNDPYSQYLTKEQYREMIIHTTGTYSGIGVYVGMREGYVTVIAPIKGSPADEAGLRAQDRIVRVDGKDIVGLSIDEVVSLIKGEKGTEVVLTVQRQGLEAPFDMEVTRAIVEVNPVIWDIVTDNVGYVRITEFNEHAAEKTRRAVNELTDKRIDSLILDLRQNPGGLLEQCLEIAKIFIPDGPIVEVVGREGKENVYKSKGPGFSLPLVVLVDRGSASASEILAGAIRDRGVGLLVGTGTFGKGLVQSLIETGDQTAVKITSARYYTPNGISINGTGIQPDIVVDLPPGEIPMEPSMGLDTQVKKALEVLQSLKDKKGGTDN